MLTFQYGLEAGAEPSSGVARYFVEGVPVSVAVERVQYLDDSGRLITESLTDYTRKTLLKNYASLDEFLAVWKDAEKKQAVVEALANQGVFLDELAFRRVCDGTNTLNQPLPFQLVMIPKSSNSAGLQLTDLMARPVALHHLRSDQPNRAFEIIQTKFRRSPAGKYEGWGLKRLP